MSTLALSRKRVVAVTLAAGAAAAFCADQYAGHDLGQINGALCELASSSAGSSTLFDVTDGNNVQAGTGIAGYSAGAGWDAVTGLGTPNGANFVPAPVAAANS